MVDRTKIRTMALLAKSDKLGIERDIHETRFSVHEYVFKKLFFRTIFLFLLSFCGIMFFKFFDVLANRDLFEIEYFVDSFTGFIFTSFTICFVYILVLSIVFVNEYRAKVKKVENYFNAVGSVEDNIK